MDNRDSVNTASMALYLQMLLTLILPAFTVKAYLDGMPFPLISVKMRDESSEETSQATGGR